MKKMNIAVFHNFMDNIGGAEIVTLTLARELHADIYTTNIDTDKISKMGFSDRLPNIFSIGKIPKNAPWRQQLAFWMFKRLNLGKTYDFYIISGDWAMSGAVHNKPNLWYVHSPLNELWEFKDYIRKVLLAPSKRYVFDVWVWINRKLTLRYAKHVHIFVANSLNTAGRLKKYYSINAEIIHPPVYTTSYLNSPHQNYWLSVNRLSRPKRIEIQVEAFRNLPNERLIIVGSYEKGARQFEKYREEIESTLPKNITLINWASDIELKELYSECKGFITTASNEDFGMTVVEALASGKPVIAPDEGGYKESVISGVTGTLIHDIDSQKLKESIENISREIQINPEKYTEACTTQANKFDTSLFIHKIKTALEKWADNLPNTKV